MKFIRYNVDKIVPIPKKDIPIAFTFKIIHKFKSFKRKIVSGNGPFQFDTLIYTFSEWVCLFH